MFLRGRLLSAIRQRGEKEGAFEVTHGRECQGRRVANLDYVRLVCNFMVIIFHPYPFMYFTSKGLAYWSMTYLVYYLGDVFLPTLFVVSGWCMFRNWDLSWATFGRKLWSRFKRLFIPHVTWNVLYLILFVLIGMVVPRAASKLGRCNIHDLWSFLKLVLPVPGWPILDSALWFVQALMFLACISPIIYLIFRWSNKWVAILIGSLPIVLIFYMPRMFFSFYPFPAYSLSCFYYGALVAYHSIDLCEVCEGNGKWLVPLGVFSVTGAFVLHLNGVNTDDCTYGIRDVELLLAGPMLLALSGTIARFCERMKMSRLLPVGFFIYAAHGIVVSSIVHSLGGMGLHPWFVWCASVAVAPTVLILSWKVWHRLSPRTLVFFDGSL